MLIIERASRGSEAGLGDPLTDPDESDAIGRQVGLARVAVSVSSKRVPIIALLGVMLSAVLSYVFWALVTAFGPNVYYWGPWIQSATAIAAIALGVVSSLSVLLWAASQSFQREAQRARQQIDGPDGSTIYVTGERSIVTISSNDSDRESEGSSTLIEPDVHESMLTEIYSHGIAQAKLSFFISLIFGALGSLILLFGAGLAITHASSNGQRYAAVVTQVSGVVINLLAGVFFLQSNRTRKDMGAQGVMLRDDSRSDRQLKAAGLLADNISDEELRNQTRAQMALQLVQSNAVIFAAAEADHGKKTGRSANGARDQAKPRRGHAST